MWGKWEEFEKVNIDGTKAVLYAAKKAAWYARNGYFYCLIVILFCSVVY